MTPPFGVTTLINKSSLSYNFLEPPLPLHTQLPIVTETRMITSYNCVYNFKYGI